MEKTGYICFCVLFCFVLFCFCQNMRSLHYNPQHPGLKPLSRSNMQLQYFMRKKPFKSQRVVHWFSFGSSVLFLAVKRLRAKREVAVLRYGVQGPGTVSRGKGKTWGVENTGCGGNCYYILTSSVIYY